MRSGIVKIISGRKQCRRAGSYSNPRFLNRIKPDVWTALSMRDNIDSRFKLIGKVLWEAGEGFVFGRRTSGYPGIRKLAGERLNSPASFKSITRLESASTFLIERRGGGSSLCREHRVCAACK